jgi:hypothetical protein
MHVARILALISSAIAVSAFVGVAPAQARPGDTTAFCVISPATHRGSNCSSQESQYMQENLDEAMRYCSLEGNNDCVLTSRATNGCVASAASDNAVSGGAGATAAQAESDALTRNGGGKLIQKGLCSTDIGTGPSPYGGRAFRFDRAGTPGNGDPAPNDGAALTAKVNDDVDLYDEPGGVGQVIGVLSKGKAVTLVEKCRDDNWCHVTQGWVWGDFLTLD